MNSAIQSYRQPSLGASRRAAFIRAVAKLLVSRTTLAFLAGGLLVQLFRRARETWVRIRAAQAEFLWRRHVDFSVVQACVMSTEHLQSLGRVEKRTLFVKPIAEVFRNEYILARVLEAAQNAANSKDPMLMTQLSEEDKWHVLNTCTNHISACFAPYHVFFNEARRSRSYYKSAWYVFTLTCAQTEACGRWFITPHKPVGAGDCGSLRIRMVLINEQELREIAEGTVDSPETGMCNGRHDSRWQVLQRFAGLFARQLQRVSGRPLARMGQGPPRSLSADEQPLRRASMYQVASQVRLSNFESAASVPDYEPEDNSLLRIHIPFPSTRETGDHANHAPTQGHGHADELDAEAVARDVVLFE